MMLRAAFLAFTLLPLGAAALDGAAVRGAVHARGDRFIEAPHFGFVANSATQVMTFGESAVEVRPRGLIETGEKAGGARAQPAALRYEFAGAARVVPTGAQATGVTYNWFIGSAENWATDRKSFSQVRYEKLWPGVDATYSGDAAGIKYHFDVAPGANARAIRFTVSGAADARIAADGAVEWTVAGAVIRDEPPVAYQTRGGVDEALAARFRLERVGNDRWTLAIEVPRYDPNLALVVDPAWTAFAGLVGGNASDQVYGVIRDGFGSTFACGSTASTNLPMLNAYDSTANGGDDIFVIKFNSQGNAEYVTYIGGNGFDACTGIARYFDNQLFIVGGTTSTNFPFQGNDPSGRFRRTKTTTDRDAFVLSLTGQGNALMYSGLLGGSGDDQAMGVAVDTNVGKAHVTGYTRSSDFPVTNGGALNGGMDAFVARLPFDGSTVEYSILVGGNGDVEVGRGIALTGLGAVIIAGETNSTAGLPGLTGAQRTIADGPSDGFVAKIGSSGTLAWLRLLAGVTGGASGIDRALAVGTLGGGVVYVAGETDSTNFPANDAGTRLGSGPQNTPAGNMDGFLVSLTDDTGTITGSTYLGGTRFDTAEAVAVDAGGVPFVAGTTSAESPSTFPVSATPGLSSTRLGAQDGFLAKFGTGAPLAFSYSGFLGSSLGGGAATTNDAMHAIATSLAQPTVLAVGGATGANASGYPNGRPGALGAAGAVNGIVLRLDPFRSLFDTNGDGRSDLVWQNTDGRHAIWLMNAQLPLETREIIGAGTGWSVVLIADFNADGNADLVWQHTDGRIAIYLMNGTVPLLTQQILNAGGGWSAVHAADLNGDGKADLVFRNDDGRVAVWTMDGATMTAGATIIGPGTGWSVIKTGDFNGDGKADLLWKHADGRHAIWLMNGIAVASTAQILNAGGWTAQHAADLDGDGKADIVWQHTDGTIAAWLMNGTAMASGSSLLGPGSGWSVVRTGDLDGDGRADLFFQHTDGRVAIWTMAGLTIKGTGEILGAGTGWSLRRVLDLNGDGFADIVWQHTDGRTGAQTMNGFNPFNPQILLGPGTGWSVLTVSQ